MRHCSGNHDTLSLYFGQPFDLYTLVQESGRACGWVGQQPPRRPDSNRPLQALLKDQGSWGSMEPDLNADLLPALRRDVRRCKTLRRGCYSKNGVEKRLKSMRAARGPAMAQCSAPNTAGNGNTPGTVATREFD